MSLKFLLDMNLSPQWIPVLAERGFSAIHWSQIGDSTATDTEIMNVAARDHLVIMTQDLDFTILLALTHATQPSVVLIRSRNAMPDKVAPLVVNVLQQYLLQLVTGALLVIDESQQRLRCLPLV
jgi:predicted nuclease of predicted toxin-antitoxin system